MRDKRATPARSNPTALRREWRRTGLKPANNENRALTRRSLKLPESDSNQRPAV